MADCAHDEFRLTVATGWDEGFTIRLGCQCGRYGYDLGGSASLDRVAEQAARLAAIAAEHRSEQDEREAHLAQLVARANPDLEVGPAPTIADLMGALERSLEAAKKTGAGE